MNKMLKLKNGAATPCSKIPVFDSDNFRDYLINAISQGKRLAALFIQPDAGKPMLFAVICDDADGSLEVCAKICESPCVALTKDITQAHWFEREIHENQDIVITQHPWLKPIRFQPGPKQQGEIIPGVTDYFEIKGEEIHEVAVGPVHAGVIEPGHFRFQCHGEKVFHLEIELGYQHRGIEKAILRSSPHKTLCLIEAAAGDTTIGHATAHAMVIEALVAVEADKNVSHIRAVALELERMANHTGDLGALAGDVGFLPTSAYCGRIRGDILNTTALICGNRFGRGLIKSCGSGYNIDCELKNQVLAKLDLIEADLKSAISLIWDTPSVISRFEETGIVSTADAVAIGMVGVAARACGIKVDTRLSHPFGAYRQFKPELALGKNGDVYGRAHVRWLELQDSLRLIRAILADLSIDPVTSRKMPALAPDSFAVAVTEGWRGEICHVGITNADGQFKTYKMIDPSFHNWYGLALSLRNQEISDFPLCNKSFNLSYCGHDL